MPILPADVMMLLAGFAPVFSTRVWRHVPLLVVGAILAPGQRTVAAVLRVMGLDQVATFQTYHRVLNRARWSSRLASQILFSLLVATFAAHAPLVVGIDETLERRRGRKINAAGIYRDPVRSSRSHFVKVRALRWVCAMLLVPIPWAGRTWALPILTVLAPSEREATRRRRRYKPLTTWARQMIRQIHRWAPDRPLVVVGDRSYAALELLDAVRPIATVVARLRLDAAACLPHRLRARHTPKDDRAWWANDSRICRATATIRPPPGASCASRAGMASATVRSRSFLRQPSGIPPASCPCRSAGS